MSRHINHKFHHLSESSRNVTNFNLIHIDTGTHTMIIINTFPVFFCMWICLSSHKNAFIKNIFFTTFLVRDSLFCWHTSCVWTLWMYVCLCAMNEQNDETEFEREQKSLMKCLEKRMCCCFCSGCCCCFYYCECLFHLIAFFWPRSVGILAKN